MGRRIVLVRHGRSAHNASGRLDRSGLDRWFVEYDAAGIADDSQPPIELRLIAQRAGIVAASDLERARTSAERLVPGASIVISPLLRETSLPIPSLGSARLPLGIWALAIGLGWIYRRSRGEQPAPGAHEQATAAAAWLIELAERHDSVLAVTHGSIRPMIARSLIANGWIQESGGRRFRHWSAWTFIERDAELHDRS
jgi:broad specificity phosphatase PhoE